MPMLNNAKFVIGLASTVIVVAAGIGGCAAGLATPVQDDIAWLSRKAATVSVPVSLADLHQGRQIYTRTCASCHTLFRPEHHSPEQWPGLITRMIEEGEIELTQADQKRLVWYLTSASARLRGSVQTHGRVH